MLLILLIVVLVINICIHVTIFYDHQERDSILKNII